MAHFISTDPWPNSIDAVVTAAFLALTVILPSIGYAFMVRDFRAYLRSLRRGLVHITHYMAGIPDWARHETPRSIAALGLRMPCSEEDLKRTYRRLVKQLHPDHGGDERRFLLLQAHFEEALEILHRERSSDYHPRWSAP
ncbi:MAG: J domain-containing protein [Planctomycetia bacterium]|nr:J domain-containing protein [Planctomycetia bacterium]